MKNTTGNSELYDPFFFVFKGNQYKNCWGPMAGFSKKPKNCHQLKTRTKKFSPKLLWSRKMYKCLLHTWLLSGLNTRDDALCTHQLKAFVSSVVKKYSKCQQNAPKMCILFPRIYSNSLPLLKKLKIASISWPEALNFLCMKQEKRCFTMCLRLWKCSC